MIENLGHIISNFFALVEIKKFGAKGVQNCYTAFASDQFLSVWYEIFSSFEINSRC
jgi:hypothetical protein